MVEIDNILIDRGAAEMRELGFKCFELRQHGPVLRVALCAREFEKVCSVEIAQEVVGRLKALGYKFIALDLEKLEETWLQK